MFLDIEAQEYSVSYDFGQLINEDYVVWQQSHLVVCVVAFVEHVAYHC